MVVGISKVDIFFPEAHSLKEKRQSVKRIIEKTRARFNISIVEAGQLNLWQKTCIGFSVTGINKDHVDSTIENVHKFIESLYLGEVIGTSTEIMVIGDAI